MGTKISALTETGSAPTGAYYPLEHDNANYKISTETLRGNLGGKYTEGYASSIGGTTVEDGALLTVTHNLGTEDVIVQVYIADDADGTNNVMLNNQSDGSGSYVYDYQVQAAATNSIQVQLSASGWSKNDGTSTVIHTNYRFAGTSKFIKVVVLSAGTGLGGKYTSGWAAAPVAFTDVTYTHDLGTADVIAKVYASLSSDGSNPQEISSAEIWAGVTNNGASVVDITSTTITVRYMKDWLEWSGVTVSTNPVQRAWVGGGTYTGPSWVKVVVLSAGSSGGTATSFMDSAAIGNVTTVDYKIGDLQGEGQVFISASIRHSLIAAYFQINATYGLTDATGTRVLSAMVNASPYMIEEGAGGSVVTLYSSSTANFYLFVDGEEVFARVTTGGAGAGTVFWSYKTF